MKKGLFILAVFVMVFGNVGLAQHKANLKSNATQNVLKHYGVRDDITIVPETAVWQTVDDEHYRTTYSYDEYDYYLVEELTECKLESGWKDWYLVHYDYDFSGNVLEIYALNAFEGDSWEDDSRASYSYENGELSEVVYQYWDGNDWVNDVKEVYNYNGEVSTVLYWDWNGTNWTSDELYTYTRNGNTIELVMQYMQGGAWQNMERCTYTLDFDDNILEILVEFWVNNTMWEFHQKNVYHYNGGVYTSMTVEVDNGLVVQQYDYSYEYGNATHGECKIWTGGSQLVPGDGEIEMAYGFNYDKKTFYGSVVEMTYFDVTQVDENVQAANFKVYPVPAENEIQIQSESFQKAEIYSLTGQKMMESQQNNMNVSQLSSGLYIIKVYDLEGNCATQRFVVK